MLPPTPDSPSPSPSPQVVLMLLLALFARWPAAQAQIASVFVILNSSITIMNAPYNDFKKNTNEVIMAALKPVIFILASVAAMLTPLAGAIGTAMTLTLVS